MEGIATLTGRSQHQFQVTHGDVVIEVTITGSGGDPAIARGLTDEVAQIVEDGLVSLTTPPQNSNVLRFPRTA